MDFRYAFVYATVNVFCILISLIVLSKLSYNMGSERELRIFRLMVYIFVAFLVCELIWVLSVAHFLPIPLWWGSFFKILGTLLIPLKVYCWFIFAETQFGSQWTSKPLYVALAFIPMALLIIIYLISIKTGATFSIDSAGEIVVGPAAGLTGLVDNIYGITIIVHAIILTSREKVRYRRRVFWAQAVFIIICTAGGIIDAVVSQTPVMPLAIALSFVFLLATIQEGQIYNDALTGLNNRRRAERYILECLDGTTEETPLHLFMLDIDGFKGINDTMGHLEGDQALRIAAQAIAQGTAELDGFVARWGGDEFIAVTREQDEHAYEHFCEAVRRKLAALTHDTVDYKLALSIGHAVTYSSKTDMTSLIDEADKMLYEQKALVGAGR